MAEVAISLQSVGKVYPGAATPVVAGLNLDVSAGEIVALVGPSGCGKTTTLKMINRLVEPTSGTIEVLGADVGAVPVHELRRRIGYVIQQVGLFPHRTVRANIGVVCELVGWDKARVGARSAELAALVGLAPDVLDRYPAELSGGQQQRVGVARALAADPPILLMDEPYSAVDPVVRARLQDELLALQQRVGKTIVFVTHDIDEALRLGDKVAVMNVGGVLAQYGAPDELLRAPADAFVADFLGRERGLRRLALRVVGDVAHRRGPVADVGASVTDAASTMATEGTGWIAVVDAGCLIGWVDRGTLDAAPPGATVGGLPRQRLVSWVTPTTPLREALDVIVTSGSRLAAVLADDDQRTLLGFVDVDAVAGGLT